MVGAKLTARQERFVEAMLTEPTIGAAAERAGYSAATAAQQGSRLLRNSLVRARLDELRRERAKLCVVSAARVHEEIACLAFFDPADLADVQTLDDLRRLPIHVRRAVTGWRYDKDGRLQLDTAKPKALEMLGRTLGMFTDRTDLRVGMTLEDLVASTTTREYFSPTSGKDDAEEGEDYFQ